MGHPIPLIFRYVFTKIDSETIHEYI